MAKFTVDIETPMVPNFLKVKLPGQKRGIAISDFTDDQLKAVADAWALELIAKARKPLVTPKVKKSGD